MENPSPSQPTTNATNTTPKEKTSSSASLMPNTELPSHNTITPLKDTKSASLSCHTSSSCSSNCSPTYKSHEISHRQRKYERKTKRFIWPEELHQLFVAAIFDVGLKNASPKTLLTLMKSTDPMLGLTTEHLKSHLQKYRINYERSRQEFLKIHNEQNGDINLFRLRKRVKKGKWGNSQHISTNGTKKRHRTQCKSDWIESEMEEESCCAMMEDRFVAASHGPRVDTTQNWAASAMTDDLESSDSVPSNVPRNGNLRSKSDSSAEFKRLCASHNSADATDESNTDRSANLLSLPQKAIDPENGSSMHCMTSLPSEPRLDRQADLTLRPCMSSANDASTSQDIPPDECTVEGDPQWSILSSLLSSDVAISECNMPISNELTSLEEENKASIPPCRASSEKKHMILEPSMLHEGPSDVHTRIQLAMQAQMTLHRQMLLRKVAISQQLLSNDKLRSVDPFTIPSNGLIESSAWFPPNPHASASSVPLSASIEYPLSLHPSPNDNTSAFCSLQSIDSQPNSCTSSTTFNTALPNSNASSQLMKSRLVSTQPFNPSLYPISNTNEDLLNIDSWSAIDLNLKEDDLFGFLKG